MFGSGTIPGPSTPWADDIPFGRLPEWVLRGMSQVVFQNNPLTGIIFIIAVFYNSPVFGVFAILGTTVATLTGMALKASATHSDKPLCAKPSSTASRAIASASSGRPISHRQRARLPRRQTW